LSFFFFALFAPTRLRHAAEVRGAALKVMAVGRSSFRAECFEELRLVDALRRRWIVRRQAVHVRFKRLLPNPDAPVYRHSRKRSFAHQGENIGSAEAGSVARLADA
jgi:hypothetical protein